GVQTCALPISRRIVLELDHVAEPRAAAPLDPEADGRVGGPALSELVPRVPSRCLRDGNPLLRSTLARLGERIGRVGDDFGVHESVPSSAVGAVPSSAARAAFFWR